MIKKAILSIAVVAFVTGCAGGYDGMKSKYGHAKKKMMKKEGMMEMPFSGPDSVNYAGELWTALGGANMVGGGLKSIAYKGVHPHGAVLTTDTGSVTVGGHKGKVVVKKNFGGEGVSIDSVTADSAKYLKAVTVMFQREDGYDADNQNWFWAKFTADGGLHKNPKGMQLAGRVAKGKPQGCISCHTAAPGGDYIFTN